MVQQLMVRGVQAPPPPPCEQNRTRVKTSPSLVLRTWSVKTGSTDRMSPLAFSLSSFGIELISPIKRVLKAISDPEETAIWSKTVLVTSAN